MKGAAVDNQKLYDAAVNYRAGTSPLARAQGPHPEHNMLPDPAVLADQSAFLKSYALIGVITIAAQHANVSRSRHYEWLNDPRYPDYFDRFKEAHAKAVDRLEGEAIRRAIQGVEEPVFGSTVDAKGNRVTGKIGTVTKYSDRLLEVLLRAKKPEVYRENLDITSGGEKLTGTVKVPLEQLREELKLLNAAVDQIAAGSMIDIPAADVVDVTGKDEEEEG